jgi:uncharacterized protein YgiM (DUF1202 family)
LGKEEIIMAYRTDDGRVFDNQSEAQTHANKLASDAASASEAHRLGDLHANDQINDMIKWYNAGNWDKIIKDSNIDLHYKYFEYAAIKSIAHGKRGDYKTAYSWFITYLSHKWDEPGKLTHIAEATAKEAWEKANGRSMTFDDEAKIRLPLIENIINYWQRHVNKYGAGYNDHSQKTLDYWISQRKLYRGKGSSSSGNGSSIITKIISAVIGAVICGMLLKFLPSFIAVIGGGVAGWFLGGALKKKFIVIGIIAVVVLLFGQRIIGSIGNKSSITQTQMQTATVTSDAANFRSAPSTSGDIIKTLKKGDTLTVTGNIESGWVPVKHGNDTGYVSVDLVVFGSASDTGTQTASSGQAATAVSETQTKVPTSFSDLIGTWKRNNYGNTLTFTANTLKSSSQDYTWDFVSASSGSFRIRSEYNSGVEISIRLTNGNIVISGDSGGGEDNWNGTWIKQ